MADTARQRKCRTQRYSTARKACLLFGIEIEDLLALVAARRVRMVDFYGRHYVDLDDIRAHFEALPEVNVASVKPSLWLVSGHQPAEPIPA
jgi:hypothetical protein